MSSVDGEYRKQRPFSSKNYVYTESELDDMVDVMLEAERIKSDPKVFRMVTDHMKERGEEIKSIQDIRDKMAGYGES